MNSFFKIFVRTLAVSSLVLSFSIKALSYEEGAASRKYDSQKGHSAYSPKLRSNYSRYKGYSPAKKKRYKKKWSSFKESSKWDNLSEREKSKVRRKVLKKRQNRSRAGSKK